MLQITTAQAEIHTLAKAKGWWTSDRNPGELIALIHSELSELLEALREGNPQSTKIPEYTAAEEEAADVLIRLLDMAEAMGWDLEGAVEEKHLYNASRPYRHGKAF